MKHTVTQIEITRHAQNYSLKKNRETQRHIYLYVYSGA